MVIYVCVCMGRGVLWFTTTTTSHYSFPVSSMAHLDVPYHLSARVRSAWNEQVISVAKTFLRYSGREPGGITKLPGGVHEHPKPRLIKSLFTPRSG